MHEVDKPEHGDNNMRQIIERKVHGYECVLNKVTSEIKSLQVIHTTWEHVVYMVSFHFIMKNETFKNVFSNNPKKDHVI